jgi:hypothetical protein
VHRTSGGSSRPAYRHRAATHCAGRRWRALWGDLVPRASELGLAALHGSSPGVGIVGYTLGGGVSFYARKHGLASDRVTAFEIVTADGEQIRVDLDNEPDLSGRCVAGVAALVSLPRWSSTCCRYARSTPARCSFPPSMRAMSCTAGMNGPAAYPMR